MIDVPTAVSFSIAGPSPDATSPPVVETYFNCTSGGIGGECPDGALDGDETDVDCGGAQLSPGCPARCSEGQRCVTDCDCDADLVCGDAGGEQRCATVDGGAPPRDC